MALPSFHRPVAALFLLALASVPLSAQGPVVSEVQERRLSNGIRLLVVERPGGGVFHARLLIRGDGAAPRVAELTARTLFGTCGAQDTAEQAPELEALLARVEGLREELRLARLRSNRGAEPIVPELEELHKAALASLSAKLGGLDSADALDALGATRREVQAEADHIIYGLDLPSASLAAWSGLETARLKALRLPQLPFQRQRAVKEAESRGADAARLAFFAIAFPGHPYGQATSEHASALDAVGLEEARTFARKVLLPENMALVLVGDLTVDQVMPVLDRSFGSLPVDHRIPAMNSPGVEPAPGARRLQATLPGPPRLLMGWRLPPRSHPDFLGLRVLAKLLAGGPSSRLRWGPLDERGILSRLQASFGEPGSREGGLLALEAAPGEGHGLGEAEQVLISEVLRLQQEPIEEEEVLAAQRLLALEALKRYEDAAEFAKTLGEAWSQAGNWRAGILDPTQLKAWGSEELRRLARAYLSADRGVTTLVEPDLLSSGEDPLDVRLIEALRAMARRNIDDPAAVDALLRRSIRQLRMLPRAERERALELLRPRARP